jgi:hypothetical protein
MGGDVEGKKNIFSFTLQKFSVILIIILPKNENTLVFINKQPIMFSPKRGPTGLRNSFLMPNFFWAVNTG